MRRFNTQHQNSLVRILNGGVQGAQVEIEFVLKLIILCRGRLRDLLFHGAGNIISMNIEHLRK